METTKHSLEEISRLVQDCLSSGSTVEIDRLGVFRRKANGEFEFVPHRAPTVFVAYVEEDAFLAVQLYDKLKQAGLDPWMDRLKLLPGQNWPRAIERAIETCDFFVALFSRRALVKRGGFQAEVRYALDFSRKTPLDEIFFVPVRLEDCHVPGRIRLQLQYFDFFPDFDAGADRLIEMIKREMSERSRR